jgi:hypothetical protein
LFTGQNIINDGLIIFFKDANSYLENKNIFLFYLPHPSELKQGLLVLKKKLQGCSNVVVIEDKKFSTNEYIFYSIAHISLFSTCHFDAVFIKGKSFILDILKENAIYRYIDEYPNNFYKIHCISDVFHLLNL